jgi:hemoglobin
VATESTALSLFSRVGGMPFFDDLVAAFYDGIADDELLAPLYPDYPDFEPAKRRLSLFLAQYWGGPHTYMEERGHPRLRMRHLPFHIGPLERDRWLTHMAAAVERTCAGLDDGPAIARELMEYFVPAAEHLRNDTGLPISSATHPPNPKRS